MLRNVLEFSITTIGIVEAAIIGKILALDRRKRRTSFD
jgi:hypothetical protein